MKPRPKAAPILPKLLARFSRRRDVGGIGGRHRHAGRRHAADDAADEQAGQVGRPGRDEEVQAHAGHRIQQHRAAADAVADGAQHRHEEELQQAEHGGHDAVPERLLVARRRRSRPTSTGSTGTIRPMPSMSMKTQTRTKLRLPLDACGVVASYWSWTASAVGGRLVLAMCGNAHACALADTARRALHSAANCAAERRQQFQAFAAQARAGLRLHHVRAACRA